VETGTKEERGGSDWMGGRSVEVDKKFTCVGEEVGEDEGFEGVASEGVREKQGVGGVRGKQGEVFFEVGEEGFIIAEEGRKGK